MSRLELNGTLIIFENITEITRKTFIVWFAALLGIWELEKVKKIN
jgi:hypothetical protein